LPISSHDDRRPRLAEGVFLAPTAFVIGDVELGADVSFWFHTVARGDVHRIRIGERTNIQDGSVLHVTHQTHPLEVGSRVVVGHAAVLHGCTVGDGALIGVGARVLDGATVEAGAQVGAGAVVTPGTRVSAGFLALGVPARSVRRLSDQERDHIAAICGRYAELKEAYRMIFGSGTETVGD
jgi:carbonic anhydrase/acetyltransferase-like protein (isoleucine patch superfamily)